MEGGAISNAGTQSNSSRRGHSTKHGVYWLDVVGKPMSCAYCRFTAPATCPACAEEKPKVVFDDFEEQVAAELFRTEGEYIGMHEVEPGIYRRSLRDPGEYRFGEYEG